MRRKFLSVLMGLLSMSIVVSSCLDDDTVVEYSSDATIHAFGLDTIHGKDYTFTIDQLNRRIYNRDSLPVGADTIIDRILIKTVSVTGWITSGLNDTLVNFEDSVNLLPAMNNSTGMKFKAHAADGLTNREYTLHVNVHQQDPDSLMWTKLADNTFSGLTNAGEQKAIALDGNLWVYTSPTTAYVTSTLPASYAWSATVVNGLPADARLSTIVNYKNALYLTTEGKQVFSTTNGKEWSVVESLGNNVVTLIAGFSDRLCGIVEVEGKQYYNVTMDGKTWTAEAGALEAVPADFPTEHIASTLSATGNGMEKVFMTGMPQANPEKTIAWFSLDGYKWASLENTTYDVACPPMKNPFITNYANTLYCFGGEMDALYTSVTGIAWEATKKKVLLPAEFKAKGNYSIVVEPTPEAQAQEVEKKRNFIWVIFGGNGTANEVWRGRINRLGFIIE